MKSWLASALAFLFAAAPAFAFGELPTPSVPAGFELPAGVDVDALPLRSQSTTVDVAGVVARIQLTQVWENAGKTPLEATYVFPTSTRAALHDLRLKIGDRRELRAELRAKEQAQKIFDAARDAGQTAGLLEQQRPNAVTMHLTNIMPGDRITVVVEASELLRSVEGVYELVLPQTIGARYPQNAGSEAFVDNGHISGSKVQTNVDVTIRSPIGISGLGSPSHGVAPRFKDKNEVAVSIASSADDVVADRDVVLRWRLAGDQTQTGVLLFRDPDHGAQRAENFFLLLGEAPTVVEAEEAPAREVTFVVDVSGSMRGFPLQTAKGLVKDLVGELRPIDRFNMLFFSGGNHVLSETGSLPATSEHIERALYALQNQTGGGGTELMSALDTALTLSVKTAIDAEKTGDQTERSRVVVVVTDGFVSAERAVFQRVRERRGDTTVFAFGIGSSVNRMLIESLAAAGGTEPFVMLDEKQGARAVDHFRTMASRPALTHIEVRFEGFTATDLEPARAPDLFPGRPLVMLGRFTGPSSGNVVVSGHGLGGKRYESVIPIEDNLERKSHAPLRELWARERIARLADRAVPDAAALAEVERLGLRYRLLTERTSFVVVDPTIRNKNGTLAVVAQPLAQPRGVEPEDKLSTLFGAGGLGSGSSGFGSAGLGLRGSGRGGGGGNIDLGGRGKAMSRIVPGKVIYEGGLDREEIQRVVSRSMSQIKYCYERELNRDPSLKGKLVMSWTIDGKGLVASVVVVENTIGAPGGAAVAACVSRITQRWTFPAPKGGGVVNITYPFVFSVPE
ncbi:MAG: AgmX/PglI C-terminal domain-containing protein [Deltaproteobacteria bacterium]|nr:AgmX/PglI C-terminal domain-containing protein [Deltaproteobacteria bacterium]